MRIAVWHNLPSGGGKRALYDQVSGLLARGHQVEAWCPPTADREFLPLGDLVTEHVVDLERPDEGRWAHLADRATKKGTRTLRHLNAMDAHTRRCAAEISASAPDVVLAASSQEFAVTGLARHIELPTVLYLQEPQRELYEAMPTLPWVAPPGGWERPTQRVRQAARVGAMRVQAREELLGVQAYDRVLANSRFSREGMLRAYGVDAHVCYLGVDTAQFVDRGGRREHQVVGIGAFRPHKRVEVAIEAVATLRPPRPSLTWIGNDVDDAYFRRLLDLARHRQVTFTPRVGIAASAVVDALNEATVMIYAPRLEPFGYAPLEAGACGVPVVARAEGGVRETVVDGQTGLLVDDDADVGPAVERILTDEVLARRMREASRANVEDAWSLDAATTRLEAHLEAVVASRPR